MGKLLNLFIEVFNYWWACKLEIGRATGFEDGAEGGKKGKKKSEECVRVGLGETYY